MSTRDAGEQRSLLRVISTILQLTREEVAAVEARIAELEKTMVTINGVDVVAEFSHAAFNADCCGLLLLQLLHMEAFFHICQ